MTNTATCESAPKSKSDSFKNYWIIWATAAIIFIGWICDQALVTLAVIAVLSGVILAVFDESKHALPALWMFYYVFSTSSIDLTGKALWLLALVAPLAGVIIHIIRFRPKVFSRGNIFKGFTFTLIFAGLAIALGGISMPDRNPVVVLVIVALGLLLPLGYMFISATINKSAGQNLLEYVAMIMFTVGILITLQYIVYYARIGNLEGIKADIAAKTVNIGWGGPNNIAPTLSIAIPICFYYSLKKSRFSWAFGVLAAVWYCIIILTTCRGAILFTTISLPFMIVYSYFKTSNRLQLIITVCAVIATAAVIIGVFHQKIYELFERMLNLKMDDNGRFPLYRSALENFVSRPIFGVGFDYNLGGYKHNSYTPFWYHSTPLQVLSCMGIVGFIIYSAFYYWRYRTFMLSRKNPLVLAICMGLLLYDLYSWVDVNFFPPNSFIIMLIMTLPAEKNLTAKQSMPCVVNLHYYLKGKQNPLI